MSLKGKIAVITGAGRGIGRVIALRFVKEGGYIVLNDIDSETMSGVVKEIELLHGKVKIRLGDVATKDGAESLIDLAVREFGRIDILVNNAEILNHNWFHKMTEEQ